jgi:hypothetical protein
MAKGQVRSNKEKRKPKQDKNKGKGGATAVHAGSSSMPAGKK